MDVLKLVALDEEDLKVLSAHAQDSLMLIGDIDFDAPKMRFIVPMNRFVWEKRQGLFARLRHERRRAVLHFDRVAAMRTTGIRRDRPKDVLSLLAIRFVAGTPPAGTVELVFSGDAAVRLDVECIEARLADLGAAWETHSRPTHNR